MSDKRPPRPRFTITLEAHPHPDGTPPAVRMRGALKLFWRWFRLKCVDYSELPKEDAK